MVTIGFRSDQAYVFFSLAADPRPTSLPSGLQIPVGSDLYLTDTNNQLKWTGAAWYDFAQDVDETPVYNPVIFALNSSIQQVADVLTQILAAQKYSNILLGSSTNGSPDDADTVSTTLMQ